MNKYEVGFRGRLRIPAETKDEAFRRACLELSCAVGEFDVTGCHEVG